MKKSMFLFLFWVTAISSAHAFQIITKSYESFSSNVPAHGMTFPESKIYRFPYTGWIIEATGEVVNGPWQLLHHGWAFNIDRKDTTCPALPLAIYATGREHISVRLPRGFGLPVKKGERWRMGIAKTLMFHNDDDVSYPNVKFRITFKFFVPENQEEEKRITSLRSLFLNLGSAPHIPSCSSHSTYWIQPGEQIDRFQHPIKVLHPFKIVFLGAHLHNFARTIRLLVNGKEIWRATPATDSEGKIISIPTTFNEQGIALRTGDEIMLESKYTNPTGEPVDAMGIVGMGVIYSGKSSPLQLSPPSKNRKEEPHHPH